MNTPDITDPTLWPLVVFFILTLLLITFILAVSYVLGQRHRSRMSEETYECGLMSSGTTQVRFAAKFYLMAMFFVIFDLECQWVFSGLLLTDGKYCC